MKKPRINPENNEIINEILDQELELIDRMKKNEKRRRKTITKSEEIPGQEIIKKKKISSV